MKTFLVLLLVSGVARAADPTPLPSDVPTVVELRVGDEIPFDGVLTEAGEYVAQGKGAAAVKKERDELRARPSVLVVVLGAVGMLALGVVIGYGGAQLAVKGGAR